MKILKQLLWAFGASFIFLLIFSPSTSPLYIFYGGDAPFFEIIGLGITQGKIPYVDLFDHKGPLVFFFNALGFSFGIGKYGILILQTIFLGTALFFMYKTASLVTSTDRKAFATVTLTLIPLLDFIAEGNRCEEWMLPFVAAALFFSLRYILSPERHHSPRISFLYGVASAIAFYIRPTDGVMWAGGIFLGMLIYWTVKKYKEQILPNIAGFIGGYIVVSAPIFAYFSVKKAIPEFIYGMIIHNVKYACDGLFTWGGVGMILIPVIIIGTAFILVRKSEKSDIMYVLFSVLALTVILIGKRDYYHYLLPFTPFIALTFGLCMERRWKVWLWIVCSLFAIFSYRCMTYIVKAAMHRQDYKTLYEQTDSLFKIVPESERQSIWNYNLLMWHGDDLPNIASLMGAYLNAGVTPGNRVFAYFQLEYLDETDEIVFNRPKWVLMQPQNCYQKDFDFIFENYELVAATPAEPVCEVRLYRLKEFVDNCETEIGDNEQNPR